MAALTASTYRVIENCGPSIRMTWRLDNANTFYPGGWTAIPGANALTADRGYLVEWQNEINLLWAGMFLGISATNSLASDSSIVGDTSASPVVEGSTEAGSFVLMSATVTGVSGQTDVGRSKVYASNDNDLTVTANQAPVVGRVRYWITSTTCDVLFHGMVAAWFTT